MQQLEPILGQFDPLATAMVFGALASVVPVLLIATFIAFRRKALPTQRVEPTMPPDPTVRAAPFELPPQYSQIPDGLRLQMFRDITPAAPIKPISPRRADKAQQRLNKLLSDNSTKLPALIPALAENVKQIRELASKPQARVATLIDEVKKDPAVAARVLQLINSPLIGLWDVDDLDRATEHLDKQTVSDLVTLVWLRDRMEQEESTDLRPYLDALSDHSMHISASTGLLAQGISGLATHTGLLAGLLHEVGTWVVLRTLHSQDPKLLQSPGLVEQVVNRFAASAGRRVAETWQMPDSLVDTVAYEAEAFEASGSHTPFYRSLVVLAKVMETGLPRRDGELKVLLHQLRIPLSLKKARQIDELRTEGYDMLVFALH